MRNFSNRERRTRGPLHMIVQVVLGIGDATPADLRRGRALGHPGPSNVSLIGTIHATSHKRASNAGTRHLPQHIRAAASCLRLLQAQRVALHEVETITPRDEIPRLADGPLTAQERIICAPADQVTRRPPGRAYSAGI